MDLLSFRAVTVALHLIVVVAGLIAALVRVKEVARQRMLSFTPRLVVGSLAAAALIWAPLAWLLHGWLDRFVEIGLLGSLVLAGLGFAVGWLRQGQACFGFGLVFGLLRPDVTLCLWLVIPALVGFLASGVVGLRLREWRHQRELSKMLNNALTRSTLGRIGPPPGQRDRVVRIVYLTSGLLPLIIALAMAPAGEPTLSVLRLLGSAIIAAHFYMWDVSLQSTLLRDARLGVRLRLTFSLGLALIIASTPLGTSVAALSTRHPLSIGVALATVVGLRVVLRAAGPGPGRILRPGPRLARLFLLLSFVHQVLLGMGLFPFFMAGVFHPSVPLLSGAVVLIIAEVGISCIDVFWLRSAALRNAQATQLKIMADVSEAHRMEIWGKWLFDAFLERPEEPDISLIIDFLRLAVLRAHGQSTDPGLLMLGARRHIDKEAGSGALRWIQIADEALAQAEAELPGRWPDEHRETLRPALDEARANSAQAKAVVFQYLNRREDALAAWREAAAGFDALGKVQTGGACRVSAASLLAGMLARPEAALEELEPVLTDEALSPVVIRYALVIASLAEGIRGDLTAAKTMHERGRRIRLRRRDAAELLSEAPTCEPAGFRRHSLRALKAIVQSFERMVDRLIRGEPWTGSLAFPAELDFPPRSMTLRGTAMLEKGEVDEGRALLQQAAELAEKQGYLTWAFQANYELAKAHVGDDLGSSYLHLQRAIRASEAIRDRVLQSDERIDVGGQYMAVYAVAVRVLLTFQEETSQVWPSRPPVVALGLVEQARSRVFLETLGEGTPLAPPPEATWLLALEDEALAQVHEARSELEEVQVEQRLDALGKLREACNKLDAIRSRLAEAGPAAAEYVELRRGTPWSFDEFKRLLTL